jgi:hypothetical protein
MKKLNSIVALCTMLGTVCLNAQINVGTGNVINSTYSSIAAGMDNKITLAADHTIIASGRFNTNAAVYTAIGGGKYNSANESFSTIPGGRNAKTRSYGQLAYGSGSFSSPGFGEAQFGLYVLRGSVSGATTNNLSLDGGTNYITIPANGSFLLDIDVASRSTSPANSVYGNFFHWKVAVENQNGDLVCQWLDTKSVTNHNANLVALYSCDSDKFIISGTGETGNTVYWVATVRATECVKP